VLRDDNSTTDVGRIASSFNSQYNLIAVTQNLSLIPQVMA